MQGDKNDFRADPMSEGPGQESAGGGGTRAGTEGQRAHADRGVCTRPGGAELLLFSAII